MLVCGSKPIVTPVAPSVAKPETGPPSVNKRSEASVSTTPRLPTGRRVSRFGCAPVSPLPRPKRTSVALPNPVRRRSRSEPTLDTMKLIPLPDGAKLRFWQVALLCSEEQALRSDAMVQYCALLGIRPKLSRRIFRWAASSQATINGLGDNCDTDTIRAIKREGIRCTLSEADAGKVSYRNQGNPEFTNPDALAKRKGLKQDSQVTQSIQNLWKALAKCPSPYEDYIDRQIYQWMGLRFLDKLIPEEERHSAVSLLDDDWDSESNGEFFMGYEAFFEGIFSFVDVWCPHCCPIKYAAKVSELQKIVSAGRYEFTYSMKLVERQWGEWLIKYGHESEYQQFTDDDAINSPNTAPLNVVSGEKRISTELSPASFPYKDHWQYKGQKRCSGVSLARGGSAPISRKRVSLASTGSDGVSRKSSSSSQSSEERTSSPVPACHRTRQSLESDGITCKRDLIQQRRRVSSVSPASSPRSEGSTQPRRRISGPSPTSSPPESSISSRRRSTTFGSHVPSPRGCSPRTKVRRLPMKAE